MSISNFLNSEKVSLRFFSVKGLLKKSKLSQFPEEMHGLRQKLLENGSWLNECLSHSILGRVALRSASISCAAAAVTTHLLGFRSFSKTAVHLGELFQDRLTGAPCPPLVRTINVAKEAEIDIDVEGICAGASIYFNYLYTLLQNKAGQKDSPKSLLIRCANLFIEGGREAALKLHYSYLTCLQFESTLLENRFLNPGHILQLIPDDSKSSLQEGKIIYENQDDLRRLSRGCHILRLYNASGFHIVSLIKISSKEWFLFDPSYGLFQFEGKDSQKQLFEHLNCVYESAHKYHYLRRLRKSPKNIQVKASDMQELYMHIIPMPKQQNLPKFSVRPIPKNPLPNPAQKTSCLKSALDYLVDSWKASH